MLNFTFRGLCSPVFTFFNANLSANTKIIPKYAKYLADNGIPGVLVNGTTGESMTMTVDERKLVTEEWAKAVKATKQHLMVQVSGCPLPDAIELAKHADSIGVDSILALPELYFKPSTPLAVVNYLKHIGEAAPKTPLLYYHIPEMSRVDIIVAEMMNLAVDRLPTFVGIKFTSNDLDKGMAALKANNGKYTVFLGSNTLLSGAFAMGFDSVIASSSNIFPQYSVGIQKAIEDHDLNRARVLQDKLSAAWSIITKYGVRSQAIKFSMSLTTDMNPGPSRPPIVNLTKEQCEEMRNSLISLKIIE